MRFLAIRPLLLGAVIAAIASAIAGLWGRDHTVSNPSPSGPELVPPSALQPASGSTLARFKNSLRKSDKSYHAYTQAIELAAQIPSERLASMVAAIPPDTEVEDEKKQLDRLLHAWIRHDPGAALAACSAWPEHARSRRRGMENALEEWAAQSPDDALAWTLAFTAAENSAQNQYRLFHSLRESLVNGAARFDPAKALAIMREHKIQVHRSRVVFDSAEDWERALAHDNKSDFIQANWLKTDPKACRNWLGKQTPERRAGALATGLGFYLLQDEVDPLKAATELWPTLAGRSASSAAWKLVDALNRRNPNLAAQWLNQYKQDPTLDAARARFAGDLTELDPEAACAWIDSIHAPNKRSDTEKTIFGKWDRLSPESAEATFRARGWTQEQIDKARNP